MEDSLNLDLLCLQKQFYRGLMLCSNNSSEIETLHPAGELVKSRSKQFKIALGIPWN